MASLEKLKSIKVFVDWKVVVNVEFLTEEQFEKLCPIGDDGRRFSVCDNCQKVIGEKEIIGLNR